MEISISERNVHLYAVIKSNLISVGLTSVQIETIAQNIKDDILDVIENYDFIISEKNKG